MALADAADRPGPATRELVRALVLAPALVGGLIAGLWLFATTFPRATRWLAIDGRDIVLVLALQTLAIFLSSWLALEGTPARKRATLRLLPLDAEGIVLALYAAVALVAADMALFNWLGDFAGLGATPDIAVTFGLDAASPVRFFSILLIGGWFSPYAEELFFRGILHRWIRERAGFWPAALASSTLFGAAHLAGGLVWAITAAAIGIGLAGLLERTGSLRASVFAHRTINLVVLALWWRGAA